jgi:hypothetical protein
MRLLLTIFIVAMFTPLCSYAATKTFDEIDVKQLKMGNETVNNIGGAGGLLKLDGNGKIDAGNLGDLPGDYLNQVSFNSISYTASWGNEYYYTRNQRGDMYLPDTTSGNVVMKVLNVGDDILYLHPYDSTRKVIFRNRAVSHDRIVIALKPDSEITLKSPDFGDGHVNYFISDAIGTIYTDVDLGQFVDWTETYNSATPFTENYTGSYTSTLIDINDGGIDNWTRISFKMNPSRVDDNTASQYSTDLGVKVFDTSFFDIGYRFDINGAINGYTFYYYNGEDWVKSPFNYANVSTEPIDVIIYILKHRDYGRMWVEIDGNRFAMMAGNPIVSDMPNIKFGITAIESGLTLNQPFSMTFSDIKVEVSP